MRTTFYDILTAHAAAYPRMQPQDYVKLAFQSEFGVGHLLSDREAAYAYLEKELNATPTDVLEPLTVPIGGGFARLNLAAAKPYLSPALIFKMLERSVTPKGTREGFERKISLIRRSAKLGLLPCDGDAVAREAEALGDALPTHSALYKRLYGASYRLITDELATLAPAICLISDALRKAGKITVGIDGRAASGKTSAAALLAELFDATVISTDDYFLPVERKTPERLAHPGGNLDFERLVSEVALHHRDESIAHARFDCATQTLLPAVTEPRKELLIVEGAYAMREEMRDIYDVKLFFTTDKETQRLRIRLRDGEALLSRYEEEWIPLEEAYISAQTPYALCDLVITT